MRDFFARLFEWMIARAQERSTWAGLAVLAATVAPSLPTSALDVLQILGPVVAVGLAAANTSSPKT